MRRHTSYRQTTGSRRALGFVLASFLLITAPAHALDEGDSAPNFRAPSLTGPGTLSLEDFRGKVVLLDFWASWCTPCLSSLPQLDTLREKFPSRDFQIVAVNVDRDLDAARQFLSRHPVGYPSAIDPEGRIPELFELGTMPTSFVIDRGGVVRHVHEGFRKDDLGVLRGRIAELLGGL